MPLVDSSLEEGQKMFDANFWGTLRTVNAFTPQLIRNQGTVVNINSIGGLLCPPWASLYSASKAALRAATDCLCYELTPFGVNVLTIMTGVVETKIFANQDGFRLRDGSIYKPIQSQIAKAAGGEGVPGGMPVSTFASKVVSDVLNGRRGTSYRGNMSSLAYFMSGFLPTFILEAMVCAGTGLSELAKCIKGSS